METKERKQEIDRLLSELAKSTSPEVMWMRQLFDLQLEDARDRLIDAEGVDFQRIQGEARYLQKFARQFHAASALLRNHQGV